MALKCNVIHRSNMNAPPPLYNPHFADRPPIKLERMDTPLIDGEKRTAYSSSNMVSALLASNSLGFSTLSCVTTPSSTKIA